MKISKQIIGLSILLGGFVTVINILHAQTTTPTEEGSVLSSIKAIEMTTPVAAADAPETGTFYSARNPDSAPLPENIRNLPVWPVGGGFYLLDDVDIDPNDPYDGTNAYTPNFFVSATFTTNDLWLEITGVTNTAAYLTIHPPWNVTNGVYDLLYCTNLALPITWQWLLRSDPGQTNLIAADAADAQGFYRLGPPNDIIANDSLGTNFWITFPAAYGGGSGLSVYVSSPVRASGTLTIPGLAFTNAFNVAAGEITNISIPDARIETYDQVGNYGIQIVTSQSVSIYAVDYWQYATSSFTGYPTPLLGTNYCVMAYPGWGGVSQFAIVATANNTTVTITPTTPNGLTGHTNSYTEILQQGQTYQNYGNLGSDVTGTRITSDKPIGVCGGASVGSVNSPLYGDGNPLVQEILPIDQWGTRSLAVPFFGVGGGNNYRVLAAYNNTVIFTNGVVAGTNQAGQFLDFNIDGPLDFQGTQPIQVAHLSSSSYGGGHAPCEILLLPIGHYLETNTIIILPASVEDFYFDQEYINIIAPQSAIATTLLDGSLVAAFDFVAIGTSGYFGAQLQVTSGTHTVSNTQPIGVEVYGFGYVDVFGYFGGVVK